MPAASVSPVFTLLAKLRTPSGMAHVQAAGDLKYEVNTADMEGSKPS